MGSTLNIVTIYTSKDIEAIQPVLHHLKSLEQDHNLNISDNNPILEGQQWKPQRESFLQETDIIILLLSSSFMYSEFVKQLEFKLLIDSYKAGDSRVIPILLDDCPWDTEFLSEDYKFSFNELEVLPEQQKPIKNWECDADAYDNITANIGAIISAKTGVPILQEEQKVEEVPEVQVVTRIEEVLPTTIDEDQIAISFDEEKAEEQKLINENDLERKEQKEQKLLKEEEAKHIAADAEKLIAEAETKQKTEEQLLKGESEAKRIAHQRKLKAETVVKRRAEAEQRRLDEERRQQTRNTDNAKQKQQKQKEELAVKSKTQVKETSQKQDGSFKKRLIVGALIVVLAIIGIWVFSSTNKSSDEQIPAVIKTSEVDKSKSKPTEEVKVEPVQKEVSQPKQAVGDQFKGGIIFSIDTANKNGIVVHIDDAGPMPWQSAIKIHEQLGDGWRLPTFKELQIMRKNVGQESSNIAEFSNGLYWSSSEFDEHQARLLRFRDGNTSYHYNRNIDSRSYKVRAVRDFSW